jgi:tetratricopeptide (TPR) repeat protein
MTEFDTAIKLNPAFAIAYRDRGLVFLEQGKYDQAIAELSVAIKLDSTDAEAFSMRGEAYYRQKQYDQAVADDTWAITLDPHAANAYMFRGIAYRKVGDMTHAEADLTRATALQVYGKDAPPPAQASFTGKQQSCTINFMQGPEIFVMAKVGNSGGSYLFLLDSGADISVISADIARKLHLKTVGTQGEAGGSGETIGNYLPCLVDSITLGSCRVDHPTCVESDLRAGTSAMELNAYYGLFGIKIARIPFGGLLGTDFLRHFRVTIDYARHQVTLSSPDAAQSGTYLFNGVDPTSPWDRPLTVPITVDEHPLKVFLDTGSCSTSLPRSFVQHLDYPPEEKVSSIGAMGYGAYGYWTDYDLLVRMKDLQLGDYHLPHYLVDADTAEDGVLGTDILTHFLVTLDYPNNRLALTPVAHSDFKNDNLCSLGIGDSSPASNGRRILGLWQHSPADKVGLQPGDLIRKINGKKATLATCAKMDENKNDKTPTTVTLLVESNGKQRTVTLTQAYLFPPVAPTPVTTSSEITITTPSGEIITAPSEVVALNGLAMQQDMQQQYFQAIESYSQVLKLDPSNSIAYCFRGMDYDRLGKYDLAIADLTKAIQLEPTKYAILYYRRGGVYEKMNKHDLAKADFDTAMKLDPTSKK